MNRLAGFALICGLLASSAAASGAGASQVAHERNAYPVAAAVQQPAASVVQPLPAAAATIAPANALQRIIHASQATTRPALPPAAAELAPASQASPSSCPPAPTDIACRRP